LGGTTGAFKGDKGMGMEHMGGPNICGHVVKRDGLRVSLPSISSRGARPAVGRGWLPQEASVRSAAGGDATIGCRPMSATP
jgi:hypothetical protein